MKSGIKRQSGFTLIELMVVIAIIGLLSATIIAALTDSRKKAKVAAVKVEMHQYLNALELYYSDHNGYPPLDGQWHCLGQGNPSGQCGFLGGGSGTYSESTALADALRPYMKPVFIDINATLPWGTQGYSGAAYGCNPDPSSGICSGGSIFWVLPGAGQDCGITNTQASYVYNITLCYMQFGNAAFSGTVPGP